jgi:hypothetical protein
MSIGLFLKRRQVINSTSLPLANIISRYKFNNNVNDEKGLNNGIATNLTYVSGLVDNAGDYNGSTSKVVIADSPSLSFGSNAWSISMLVYIDSTTNQMLANKLNATREWMVYYTGQKIQFYVESLTNTNRIYIVTTNSPPTNQWFHLTCTIDDSLLVSGMNIYFNEVLQSRTQNINGTYIGMRDGSDPVVFGQHGNQTGTLQFSGNQDEVIFWDIELDATMVNDLSSAQLAGINIE